jgi:hypothetical protein
MIQNPQELAAAYSRWTGRLGGNASDFEYVATILDSATCASDILKGLSKMPPSHLAYQIVPIHHSSVSEWEVRLDKSTLIRYTITEKPPRQAHVVVVRLS